MTGSPGEWNIFLMNFSIVMVVLKREELETIRLLVLFTKLHILYGVLHTHKNLTADDLKE
jgi:hypothetical protein